MPTRGQYTCQLPHSVRTLEWPPQARECAHQTSGGTPHRCPRLTRQCVGGWVDATLVYSWGRNLGIAEEEGAEGRYRVRLIHHSIVVRIAGVVLFGISFTEEQRAERGDGVGEVDCRRYSRRG